MMAITENDGGVLLHLRVQPRASRNGLRRDADGRIRVAVTAPPAEGAANKAVIELIAKLLAVPKSTITVKAGERSREKTLSIAGLTHQELLARLDSL